jgi:hypothetical protein
MTGDKEPKPEEKDNWKPEDNSDDSSQEEEAAPKRKQPPGNVVSWSRISIVIKTLDYEQRII